MDRFFPLTYVIDSEIGLVSKMSFGYWQFSVLRKIGRGSGAFSLPGIGYLPETESCNRHKLEPERREWDELPFVLLFNPKVACQWSMLPFLRLDVIFQWLRLEPMMLIEFCHKEFSSSLIWENHYDACLCVCSSFLALPFGWNEASTSTVVFSAAFLFRTFRNQ
jgi:hypothetical protein